MAKPKQKPKHPRPKRDRRGRIPKSPVSPLDKYVPDEEPEEIPARISPEELKWLI